MDSSTENVNNRNLNASDQRKTSSDQIQADQEQNSLSVAENLADFEAALNEATAKLKERTLKYLLELKREEFDKNAFFSEHLKVEFPIDPLVPYYVKLYKFDGAAEYLSTSGPEFKEGTANFFKDCIHTYTTKLCPKINS